jgi:hypothetical protein
MTFALYGGLFSSGVIDKWHSFSYLSSMRSLCVALPHGLPPIKKSQGTEINHKMTANEITPFVIPERTIVRKGSMPGEYHAESLEGVRDYLKRLVTAQQPEDYNRTLNQLHVSFNGDRLTGQFITPNGVSDEVLLFSSHGASQVAREVLPGGFYKGLKQLAELDESGRKLATMAWFKFAEQQSVKVRSLRTVRLKLPDGNISRMIRSCHSQDYAPYSNLMFVQDLLDNGGDFAKLPVMDFRVTDSGMRLRFADSEPTLEKPIQMFEAWNSEVGRRRVTLRGGMFKLVCTNGMGHWNDRNDFWWIHRGDASRIRDGVKSAFENIKVTNSDILTKYTEAATIKIDNAFQWLEETLAARGVSNTKVEAAKIALTDKTTTPGLNLASCVDAVTLIAQDCDDMFEQFELERHASKMLINATAKAAKSNNVLFSA